LIGIGFDREVKEIEEQFLKKVGIDAFSDRQN
jgi:hypothetical protein